ncbi:MAG: sugar phosphate isomerase/epimerase family protein [Bryobacteraceae bacterium]
MTGLRFAICNEIFAGWNLGETAAAVRRAGYQGIELAPLTLAEDPAALPAAARQEARRILEQEGLGLAGLHWLLASPPGLHVTAPDAKLRRRSWDYLRRLIDLCADLGGGVLVFGSPRQRSATGGISPGQARAHLVEGLAETAPYAAERGCCLLIEALSPDQTDVVTSLEEAAAIVRQVNHPGLATMFDTHNAVAEKEPHGVLVERYFDQIRHVHLNEMDGGAPGTSDYDFRPVLEALRRLGYRGWVSLEIFRASEDPEGLAARSLRYLKGLAG